MLTPEDVKHEYPWLALFEAECGHTVEVRGAKPIEPKYLLPMTQEECPWCQMEPNPLPDEMRSTFRGGALVRKSPISVDDYAALCKLEEEVLKDGPKPDSRRPTKGSQDG